MGLFGCLFEKQIRGVQWARGALLEGVWQRPKLGDTLGWCGDSPGLCSVLPISPISAVPQFP